MHWMRGLLATPSLKQLLLALQQSQSSPCAKVDKVALSRLLSQHFNFTL
jgi:hypothetical protein